MFLSALTHRCTSDATGGCLVSERQRHVLSVCLKCIHEAVSQDEPVLMAEHVRRALSQLGQLVGRISTEEVLDRIFRDFCVGK